MSRRVKIGSPLDRANARDRLEKAEAAYWQAVQTLGEAAADFIRTETAAYSLAHPRRVVEYFGGMGTYSLNVEKHGAKGSYSINNGYGDRINGRDIAQPEFMDELDRLENDTRLNGVSDAIYKFRNGVEIKG